MKIRAALLLGALALGLAPHAWSAENHAAIPPAPNSYIYDEPSVLAAQTKLELNRLLYRHDKASGEQIIFAIFNSLGEEDLVQHTNDVFKTWGIGARGKDSGILVALYWKEHKARIEVGYGLEPTLTDAKSSNLIEDILVPNLRANNPDGAISGTAVEILRILGSPLADDPKARQIVQELQGHAGTGTDGFGGWYIWFVLGLILFSIVSNIMSSAEAHFTGKGWYRPRPWRRTGWIGSGVGTGWSVGSSSGSSGGGWSSSSGSRPTIEPTFSGGGGRSGGGGASGGW